MIYVRLGGAGPLLGMSSALVPMEDVADEKKPAALAAAVMQALDNICSGCLLQDGAQSPCGTELVTGGTQHH